MTTVIFAKNVKDLAEVMLQDTTEGKTYARYTIEQHTEKIYSDSEARNTWKYARWEILRQDYETSEERSQAIKEWEADNPEPANIIFTFWWLEYRSSKWRREKIVYLSPQLGREIDNHWAARWDELSRTYKNIGTLTMATILKRLECETKHLIRARKEELKQEKLQRIRQNQIAHLGYISEDIEKSIKRFTELGGGNLSGLMSHLMQAKAQIELAKEIVERDNKIAPN